MKKCPFCAEQIQDAAIKCRYCGSELPSIGLFGVARDITERKQAEETLKKVEADYRRLAENSPDLIARFDSGLRHLYVNPAAAQAGTLAAGEYVGLTIADTGVPDPLATTWNQRIAQVLKTRTMLDVEDAFPTPQGIRYFHTRLVPELAPDGSTCSVLSLARDITERKRAEDELNRFFDLVPDMVCIASTDGFFKRINSAWRAALGYSQEELLAMPFLDLIHPDDRPATIAEVEKQVAGGATASFANRYRHKDGSYRWLEWHATPAVAGSLLFAVARDVTDRRLAEEALRESEARKAAVLESALDCIVAVDSEGHLTEFNRAAEQTFGYRREDVIGKKMAPLLIPAARREEHRAGVTRYKATGQSADLGVGRELMAMRADGTEFPVALAVVPFAVPGATGFISVIRDITERKFAELASKQAEDTIRESEASLAAAQRIAHVGNWDWDLTQDKASWSVEMCRIFGVEPGRPRSLDESLEAIHPEEREAVRKAVEDALEHKTPYSVDGRIIRPDGSMRTIHAQGETVMGEGGEPVRMRGTVQDITERMLAEERMQTFSQEIIAAREEERKHVSSTLHHDAGSLAVGVSAHLDAIEADLRSGKPGEALKWMKRTRKVLKESVAALKEAAIRIRPPELDALGLLATLRQHFSQITWHGGARIHFRENLGRRRVSGDTATILFRVAQEALTNAIAHGHAKRVDVDLRASKKEIRLTVHDNGKGFNPSEYMAREPSQLGLRVMREMAAFAGGAFAIDSGPRKGTTVRVRLPLATAERGGA